jgi:hypothetical protein
MRSTTLGCGLLIALLSFASAAQHDHDSSLVEGLEVHFAGDVDASRTTTNAGSEPASFALGPVDTLARARLVQHASALAEVVLEDDGSGHYGFDVERLEVSWEPKQWLRLTAGRFHTPLGWWNTAHHHSHWMSTTVDAPLLMRYEDDGGPLPMHTVGLELSGTVPFAGDLALEYAAAAGNGRGPTSDPPQDFSDVDSRKSALAALHLKWRALRTGVAAYVDGVHLPAGGPLLLEQIAVADATWIDGTFELVAEGAILRHEVAGRIAWNHGGYVQAAWQATELLKPYVRLERFFRDRDELYLTTPTTTEGLGGLRVDFIANAALKLEGAWARIEGNDSATARAQLSWMF